MSNQNSSVEKTLKTNRYSLRVLFNESGLTISDQNDEDSFVGQRSIIYNEICNYFNARFPARILTINMKGDEILQLIKSRSNLKNDSRKMFDVELSVSGLADGKHSQVLPVELGKFKATLKNNDTIYNFITKGDKVKNMEQNVNMTMNVTLFLYRESELDFGLNPNINFLSEDANLATIFAHGKDLALPNLKAVISKFDHNPIIPRFLIPRMYFGDFIELLNDEFGFYKSGYSVFTQDEIMYFLNKQTDPKVKVPMLDYTIILDVGRQTGFHHDKTYINDSNGSKTLRIKVADTDLKVFVNNDNVLVNDPIYISPQGKMSFKNNSSSRKVDTVRKITEVPHLESYRNLQYEYLDIDLNDVATIRMNPLTKLSYIDSTNMNREYRLCFKSVVVNSGVSTKCKLRAFRTLDYQ